MLREAVAEVVIVARLARKHPRFFADVLLKYRHDGRGLEVVNDNRPRLTRSAINKAKHPPETSRASWVCRRVSPLL